jgi:hypothetical protein
VPPLLHFRWIYSPGEELPHGGKFFWPELHRAHFHVAHEIRKHRYCGNENQFLSIPADPLLRRRFFVFAYFGADSGFKKSASSTGAFTLAWIIRMFNTIPFSVNFMR